MPNQPATQSVNLSDSPATLDDLTLDSLFPAEPGITGQPATTPNPTPETTAAPAAPAEPATTPAAPPAPAADEPFIQGSKSVYKSREAAVEGINQKDALIEQLRQRYVLATGIDPVTGQTATQSGAVGPASQTPISYTGDPKRYVDDLVEAVKSGDPARYRDTQIKLLFDALEPLAPVIVDSARQQAMARVEKEVSGFRDFYGTGDYQKALEANPELRDAIALSESDFRFNSRLPGLYKLAYAAAQGMRLPELLKAQQGQQPPSAPARTTTPATTPEPPQPAPKPDLQTADGRKAIIEAAERKGIRDIVW